MSTIVKGDPLRLYNIHSVAKYQKIEGAFFGGIKKISKKSLTKPKRGSIILPKK